MCISTIALNDWNAVAESLILSHACNDVTLEPYFRVPARGLTARALMCAPITVQVQALHAATLAGPGTPALA
jgi:hypothetical protein